MQQRTRYLEGVRAAGVAAAVLAVAVILLALAGVAAARTGQSVLTLRTVGDNDEVWLVAADGTATEAGTLSGLAGDVAASPDGSMVGYVAERGASLWVWQGAARVKTISLASAGVTGVHGVTWIAADTVLVSGSKGKGIYDIYKARLYTVNVTTGSVAAFRDVTGGEPSADISSGKVVYVRFKKLDNGSPKNDHTPLVRESLMRLDLNSTEAPEVLVSRKYRIFYETAMFAAPRLAPGGDWVISGDVPDNPEVTYTVWDHTMPWLTMFQGGICAAAWAPSGLKVAFCGTRDSSIEGNEDTCLFVLDVNSCSLTRSAVVAPAQAEANSWLGHVAWADDGRLVSDCSTSSATAHTDEVYLVGSDLTTVKDLGAGHLSVWVK